MNNSFKGSPEARLRSYEWDSDGGDLSSPPGLTAGGQLAGYHRLPPALETTHRVRPQARLRPRQSAVQQPGQPDARLRGSLRRPRGLPPRPPRPPDGGDAAALQ